MDAFSNIVAALERQGWMAAQAEEFVGLNEPSRALRHCARCGARSECGTRAPCPTSSLLLRAKVLLGGPS